MKRLFYNGKFYLQSDSFAEAVLCQGDRIACIGSTQELKALSFDEAVDLKGKTVLPGLNDSHCHISGIGATYVQVDLTRCRSIREIIEVCKEFIAKNPELSKYGLRSMGWNQDLFTEGQRRLLTKYDVDQISTDIPISLQRVCGHLSAVNSKLLELAKVDGQTLPPTGGTIEKGEDGEPNGILTENSIHWIESFLPPYSDEIKEESIAKALLYAQSLGLTSVQANDVGGPNTYGDMRILRKIYEEGKVGIRFRHQICFDGPDEMDVFMQGEGKEPVYTEGRLFLGPVKMFKDGSLGGYTALVREGYKSDPHNKGVPVMDYPSQKAFVQEAADRGWQVVTHAIGDRAIEETLDAYESSFSEEGNVLRHGLIHCQITDRALLERIARLDVPVFYQPIFLNYDLHIAEDRVGAELAASSYAFKTAEDLGIHVSYGTDAPVESLNPFPNIYSAVTRCDLSGYPEGGYVPEEKVSLEQAIDAYTIGSAYCEFQEEIKGRIQEGYLADFTVLDRDIFSVDAHEIKDIKASMTIVGGEIVFEATT